MCQLIMIESAVRLRKFCSTETILSAFNLNTNFNFRRDQLFKFTQLNFNRFSFADSLAIFAS